MKGTVLISRATVNLGVRNNLKISMTRNVQRFQVTAQIAGRGISERCDAQFFLTKRCCHSENLINLILPIMLNTKTLNLQSDMFLYFGKHHEKAVYFWCLSSVMFDYDCITIFCFLIVEYCKLLYQSSSSLGWNTVSCVFNMWQYVAVLLNWKAAATLS